MFDEFSDVLKLVLQGAQVIALVYAGYKFTRRPHDTLESRVSTLEVEVKETKQSLLQGNDRFREQDDKFHEQDKTNAVIIQSTLALIEFEIQYCLTEHKDMSDGLKQAKNNLNQYLANRN